MGHVGRRIAPNCFSKARQSFYLAVEQELKLGGIEQAADNRPLVGLIEPGN
jgi:hypothetical protein